METPIGQTLKSGGPLLWLAEATAAGVVGTEYALAAAGRITMELQWLLAAVVVPIFVGIAIYRRDASSFGFRLSPLQGWAWWAKITGLLVVIFLAAVLAALYVVTDGLRNPLPAQYVSIRDTSQIWPVLVEFCFDAPLAEEAIFRLALCVAVTARWGPRAAIAISGMLFSLIHVIVGHPDPCNLAAGFVLAWAFLKSGSLVVPIALHCLTNAFGFAIQIALFYLFLS